MSAQLNNPWPEPIAIVGIGALLPGASDLDSFWSNLVAGKDAVGEIPDARWPFPVARVRDSVVGAADKVYCTRACLLDEIALDADSLGLDSSQLDFINSLDPLFRLTLAAGKRAFADAQADSLDRSRVGVILANVILPTDTTSMMTREILGPELCDKLFDFFEATGRLRDVSAARTALARAQAESPVEPMNRFMAGLPAGLLAGALGLGGATFTLDAACASSFYAIKLACDELHAGRADAMLTGGVSRPECLYTQMGFSQLRALSRSGFSRPLDARADGLLVGEGAGMFVLKRLGDAVRAGDRIHGVIGGIGLSNDTRGGLLAPDTGGQLRAMRAAYAQADWEPESIEMIECHATGTPLGDRVEFESMKALWGASGWRRAQCPIGSVKSNVGHLLSAAGSAGLAKVLLSMRHDTIAPSANFERAPDDFEIDASPFRVPTSPESWPSRADGSPRRAALSAFGFGGINAHLLVEDYVGQKTGSAISVSMSAGTDSVEAETSTETTKADPAPEPIAIVGMEARFGRLGSLREFQEASFAGESGIGRRAGERDRLNDGRDDSNDDGCYIDELCVALDQYRISPNELKQMLPQQLLMLEVVAAAIRDARLDDSARDETGVFIGIGLDMNATNFGLRWSAEEIVDQAAAAAGLTPSAAEHEQWSSAVREAAGPALGPDRTLGALGGIVASRVAREFHIGGPSFTISAEENSGVRALEIAAEALRKGELDRAIVGAVDLAGDPRSVAALDRLRTYLEQEESEPRGAGEAGEPGEPVAPGEGAVAFVLKRLHDARRDGDRVYCVIRPAGHSGAQDIKIAPGAIEYFELSASARAADPTRDLDTLAGFESDCEGAPAKSDSEDAKFGFVRDAPAAVGSTQSIIGWTGAAAGLAGVCRAALCVYQEMLPAYLTTGSPGVDRGDMPGREKFFFPERAQFWMRNRASGPRRAGVHCRSLDGNVTRVILEEAPRIEPEPGDLDPSEADAITAEATGAEAIEVAERIATERRDPLGARGEAVFFLTCGDAPALAALARELADWARGHTQNEAEGETRSDAGSSNSTANTPNIEALARRWWARTEDGADARLGLAIVARDAAELATLAEGAAREIETKPTQTLDGGAPLGPRVYYAPEPHGALGQTGFVFPGSGNQYLGMGAEIGARWPEALRLQDEENEFLREQFVPHRSLPWRAPGAEADAAAELDAFYDDHHALIFSHVAYGTLMSDVVRGLGIEPDAVIGYSLGESAGYFALRAWIGRDEMVRRVCRSPLFTSDLVGRCDAAREEWGLAEDEAVDWSVGLVDRPAAEVKKALRRRQRVYLLIVNTPEECVVGGQRDEVEDFVRELGCAFIELRGISTVHCEVALKVQNAYRGLHLFKTVPPEGVRFYSSGYGRAFEVGRQSAADAVTAQAIGGIDFPRMIEQAYKDGIRVFIEMGPRSSCTRMIGQILGGRPHVACSANSAGVDEVGGVLRLVARLFAERVEIDPAKLYGFETRAVGLTEQIGADPEADAAGADAETGRVVIRLTPGIVEGPLDLPGVPEGMESDFGNDDSAPQSASPAAARNGDSIRPDSAVQSGAHEAKVNFETAQPVAFSSAGTLAGTSAGAAPVAPGEAGELNERILATRRSVAAAHETFLRLADSTNRIHERTLNFQMELLRLPGAAAPGTASGSASAIASGSGAGHASGPAVFDPSIIGSSGPAAEPIIPDSAPRSFSREACMEFARGSIARVLGREFASIDAHPTRVRLPDGPLMLVDRVTSVSGEAASMGPGAMTTEHDVTADRWYLDDGRIPAGVAIESGQADLFLAAWLGVDFHTRGESVYRLLDASVTYHGELPRVGSVLRFDIRIDRFIRQGTTHLFFFGYEGYCDGRPMMTMRNGCAGFFTQRQLAEGKGIILNDEDLRPTPGKAPPDWKPPAPVDENASESYDDTRLEALRAGDLAACFGSSFNTVRPGDGPPLTIPGGNLKLIDRITKLEVSGGRWGLGLIEAEIGIHPDDWFLTCHFVDDPVMPGTLMYESCLHALRVFMLRIGWVAAADRAHFEPVAGVEASLKCRGQVIPGTRMASYQLSIKEIGYGPEPYAIADALMFADGSRIVLVENMSLRLAGVTREDVESIWSGAGKGEPIRSGASEGPSAARRGALPRPVLPRVVYDHESILQYCVGRPSLAFGDRLSPFDTRFMARLPGPPFLFVDSVDSVRGEPWVVAAGAGARGLYEVPAGEWYFRANRQEAMPFSVILEIPLQICGWLTAYMGAALESEDDLHFRNLGGTATLHESLGRDAGLLESHIEVTSVSRSAGMIILQFSLDVRREGRSVYSGTTSFGFFRPEALANQVGVRGAKPYQPAAEEIRERRELALPDEPPVTPDDRTHTASAGLALPGRAYRMIDRIEMYLPEGGPRGLGFIRGTKDVNPDEWFFKAHFFQDPVWPGSLGIEAFIQLMKVVALDRWGEARDETHRFEPIAIGTEHTWAYRGQVIPTDKEVTVEASIVEIDDDALTMKANGYLTVDGRVIYEMKDFVLALAPISGASELAPNSGASE